MKMTGSPWMNGRRIMKELNKIIKKANREHSKGYGMCESALASLDQAFNCVDDFLHVQTGQSGNIEVIVDWGGAVPSDIGVAEFIDRYKDQFQANNKHKEV
jgi:hypothetical protein